MNPKELSKIPDPSLRHFAAGEAEEERRSVILELGLPTPEAKGSNESPPPMKRPLPSIGGRSVPPLDLADLEGHAGAMDQLEDALKALGLPSPPVRLDAAQAFVVSVTPAQLRQIAGWPLAGVIRPNRTHCAPPRPGSERGSASGKPR